MLEALILGIAQGISEWLPVDSSGLVYVIGVNFLGWRASFTEHVGFILFLHLGTFFAALVYFRRDIIVLMKTLFFYRNATDTEKKLFSFLLMSTMCGGILGLVVYIAFKNLEDQIIVSTKIVNVFVGMLLLVTAYLQFHTRNSNKMKSKNEIVPSDGIIIGILQGIASLPGISRSGITIAGLLFKKYPPLEALRLSFLMSLPLILGANIVFNANPITWSADYLVGFIASFIAGLLTIHILLAYASKVNFGYFVLGMALLLLGSSFIG